MKNSDINRFLNKVSVVSLDECWAYMGHLNNGGYGVFKLRQKNLKAHRIMWEICFDQLPGVFCVCHSCDHPWCVNPLHLFLGTHLDNMRDKMRKGRHIPLKGIRNGRAILRPEDVVAIRDFPKTRNSTKQLALKYGVSWVLIYKIINFKLWRHI